MKKALSAILLLLTICVAHAQKKVFQEVGEDIQSQVKAIYQDNSLVGYVVFTQLEKASADSFNYKITIMDENLNDIGVVKFKENKLFLYDVSFEQDVLCLAYFKSNFYFYEFPNKKEYKDAQDNEKSSIMTQFLSLDGKIIKSNDVSVKVTPSPFSGKIATKTFIGAGSLKQSVMLHNIQGKGFALLYGDESTNRVVAYNTSGTELFTKIVEGESNFSLQTLLTNGQYIYVLLKNQKNDANYEVLGYHAADPSYTFKYLFKDKKGNYLTLHTFGNDPSTGNVFASGFIVDEERGGGNNPKDFAKGSMAGIYTVNFNGPKKSDVSEVYSYWNDGSQSLFNKRGRNLESDTYTKYKGAFKDFQGNTYFYGSSYIKRTKIGSIISSVLTIPLFWPPIFIASAGYTKFKVRNTVLVKQNPKGVLSQESSIDADHGGFYRSSYGWAFDQRSYYYAVDQEKKNTHLIINDKNNIFIYSLNGKKVVRTIPHKEGGTLTYVFPAKEGHIMVSEYNKKARSTTVSIESL
ncbi:hypothetical protein A4D02_19090 [Niastella koreensis]|uniref:Uncharacterized protein n=2 Tax=Niastella koreensis TaxID=354356 RepID=G8TBD9_NIAKG|nr:hypothetical protein [Niastella koreensis]AEW03439.1 hypothetical protein Niako_7223 [Niastella koreensis GR20-10]OQP53810.1 hypothetical protein A4D02_19090 [Niastella koreensis]